ncbi:hypothetical protein JW707_01570 [Candidatus Woesearchaeota archaeon]|nr:hypothetical protein [Candidatus Woesearchaeota archaeon]
MKKVIAIMVFVLILIGCQSEKITVEEQGTAAEIAPAKAIQPSVVKEECSLDEIECVYFEWKEDSFDIAIQNTLDVAMTDFRMYLFPKEGKCTSLEDVPGSFAGKTLFKGQSLLINIPCEDLNPGTNEVRIVIVYTPQGDDTGKTINGKLVAKI